jgi:hypothetical protein
VVRGLGKIEVAGWVEDDRRRKDERHGQCGDLRSDCERRSEGEYEEECGPKWSAAGARRVCDALRTHEELARCFLGSVWLVMRLTGLCLTLPQG